MSILVFAPGPSQHPPPQLVPSSPRSALMGPSRGPGSYTCSWSSACTAPGPWFSSGDPEVSQEIEWNELSCSCSDWQTVFAVSTVCLERPAHLHNTLSSVLSFSWVPFQGKWL